MRKLSIAVVLGAVAAIEALFSSASSIRQSISSLGWSRRVWFSAFAALALCAAAYASWALWPSDAKQAAPAAVVAAMPKTVIASAVQVLPKEAKAKLRLPKAVQAAPAAHVLGATELPKSKHARTVSAVLDSDTGEVAQYVHEEPLPWVAPASTGSAGMYTGLLNLEPAVRLEIKQDLLTLKGISVGAVASADRTLSGQTSTFVGVGARYEW